MKGRNLRKIIFVTVLLAAFSALYSCSEAQPDEIAGESTSDVTAESESETEEEDEKLAYAPELPEKKYGGYSFRIVSRNDDMHTYKVHTRDLYSEGMNGDAINDAVYERNALIEDTYDIKIVLETYSETANETTPNTAVENSVLADSDDFDLLTSHMLYGANSALKNVFLNLSDLDYVDFEKPYWNRNAYEAFSVGDKVFLGLSDMCFSSNDNTHCMVYNKSLARDYNVGDVYDLVVANEWTYDKFRTLAANVSNDADGDGKWTDKDVYGYLIGGGSGLVNWMFAGDLHVVAKDENNIPYLDFFSEKTVELYEWTYELYKSDDSYYIASWVSPDVPKMFGSDHALFMTTQIGVIEDLRDMDSDFGVLPYPKYDQYQESYAHYVDGHAAVMCVPKTVRDLEREGILLEAFAYESYRTVLPWYYDVLMTKKNVRDNESGAMLELIYNTRVFDFAYAYDNFGLSFTFQYQVEKDNKDIASFYAKSEKVASRMLEKNINAYEKAD